MEEGKKDRHFIPAARFHFLTRLYDPVAALTTREATFKRRLIDQADIRSGHEVLDLGCGTGTLAIWVKQGAAGATVVGLDGDTEVLELARKKALEQGAEVVFDHGFSTALPYSNASFDRVLSSLFFHHLLYDDKVQTIGEVYRVLKPRGQFHVADWGKPGSSLLRMMHFFVRLLDGFENTRENAKGTMANLFSRAGFTDVRLRHELTTAFGTIALHSMKKPS